MMKGTHFYFGRGFMKLNSPRFVRHGRTGIRSLVRRRPVIQRMTSFLSLSHQPIIVDLPKLDEIHSPPSLGLLSNLSPAL